MIVRIDASMGEGGGSILRTGAGIALAMGVPVHFVNIRKSRKNPGLAEQHLVGLKLLADLTGSQIKGLHLGSKEVQIDPGTRVKEQVHVNIRTAGAIGLVLQPAILALSTREERSEIHVTGGATYGKWAPSIDYISEIVSPFLSKIGIKLDIEIKRHGFYPKGDAKLVAHVQGSARKWKIEETKSVINKVMGRVICENRLSRRKVGERIADSFVDTLLKRGIVKHSPNIDIQYVDASNAGVGITAWYQGLGFGGVSRVGELRVSAEQVGSRAAGHLADFFESGAGVDLHLADQLVPLAMHADRFRITTSVLTSHTRTNLLVLEQLIGLRLNTETVTGEQRNAPVQIAL